MAGRKEHRIDKPAEFPKPLVQMVAEVDKSVYKLYSGTYVSSEMKGFEMKVRTDGVSLFVTPTGQPELEIKPEGPGRFFMPDFPIKMEFVSEEGKLASALMFALP